MKKIIKIAIACSLFFFSVSGMGSDIMPEQPGINGLTIDGKPLSGFHPDTLCYTHHLPYTAAKTPVVSAVFSDSLTRILIRQEGEISGDKPVEWTEVITSGTGAASRTYRIYWKKLPKLDLFLALGQSNMAGRGYLTPAFSGELPGVYLLDPNGHLVAASNPMNKYASVRKELRLQGVSPSYSFSRQMHERTGNGVGIMQNCRGGSSINQWVKGSEAGLYEEAIRRAREIAVYGEIKGVIWHQGESDSKDPDYLIKLGGIVSDLRKDLGLPELFFIAGEIATWRNPAFNKRLRSIKTTIPHSDWVSSKGLLPLIDESDPHFDAESSVVLGERYAKSMLKHVYGIAW